MSQPRRVMLMIETSLGFGRDVLTGVSRYLVQNGPWSVHLGVRELIIEPPEWLRGWPGDGIISRSTTPELARWFQDTNLPVVDMTDIYGEGDLPTIWNDHQMVGEFGAAHLLERGFKNFAFAGFARHCWSTLRMAGFRKLVEASGGTFAQYDSDWSPAVSWDEKQSAIGAWLKTLPLPVGVMACNDVRGLDVLDAARRVGLAVPEQVAVLGVDDDEVLCNMCEPPLSSVQVNGVRAGYEAAKTLDILMDARDRGEAVDAAGLHKRVPPIGVVTRDSTDTLAIEDAEVAAAVEMIRHRACDGLTVTEVLESTSMSRSIMERRFRKYVGRSPQAEIRHAKLKRVRQLLTETPMSLEQIAARTGFEHTEYLSVMFKREIGMTPGQFRSQTRSGGREDEAAA